MKYILLIYENEKAWASLSESEQEKSYAEYRKLGEERRSNGSYVTGSQLAPSNVATSVRLRDGKQLIIGRGPEIDDVVLIKDFQ